MVLLRWVEQPYVLRVEQPHVLIWIAQLNSNRNFAAETKSKYAAAVYSNYAALFTYVAAT